ncbi:MAG: membrane protein insertion efficiency factor YidD [Candidatus Woesebacteria bacterium]|nr:MAG: membrane protein insertion efficiency factor YidD [Candidatus Woesebacteria bacterium]
MKKIVVTYQIFFSKSVRILFGPGCRFTPSCSEYARLAIGKHGIFHGTIIACKRLMRCHPFSGRSGFDPI